MASEGKSAFGVMLKRNGTKIAEMMKVGGVELTSGEIDMTSNDSPYGFKEIAQGLRDAGSVDIEGNFIPGDTDGQIGLNADYLAGTMQSFTIDFPAALATQWSFTAFVKNLKIFGSGEEKVSFSATVRISGKPTLNLTYSAGLTTPFMTWSTGTLVPAAAQAILEYVLEVATGTATVTVTPTATLGVIKVDGNVVASGVPSSAIALGAPGSVTDVTIEVKETSKIAKTYTIHVARAAA